MKAIVNFEGNIIQYNKSAKFFIELGKLVDEKEYRMEERGYGIRLYIKKAGEEIPVKECSYIVVKDRKIVAILDEEQKDLFKFIKEE